MCFKNIISQGPFSAQHDGIHKTNQKICFSNLIEFKYSMLPYPIIGLGFCLEGQSNEIFDPQFFSSSEPAWATDQWVKTFDKLCTHSTSTFYSYLSL